MPRKKAKPKIKIPEKEIQRAILQYLELVGIVAWRNNTGAIVSHYKGHTRLIKFGHKGSCDILGVLPGGRFLGIEVKDEKGKVSEDQQNFIDAINFKGGLAFVARTLEEVMEKLNAKR